MNLMKIDQQLTMTTQEIEAVLGCKFVRIKL